MGIQTKNLMPYDYAELNHGVVFKQFIYLLVVLEMQEKFKMHCNIQYQCLRNVLHELSYLFVIKLNNEMLKVKLKTNVF